MVLYIVCCYTILYHFKGNSMKLSIPTTITRNGDGLKVCIPFQIAKMKKLSIGDAVVVIADDESNELRVVPG